VELTQGTIQHTLCVSCGTNESYTTIFLPTRCFLTLDVSSDVSVRVVQTMPPIATKIVLQPLDNELYHCDIASAVSKHLVGWQVLSKWTTFTIQCEELGGYPVDIFVKSIEPADIVLLRGEVPLELEEPLETPVEWSKSTLPLNPSPVEIPQEVPFDDAAPFLEEMPQQKGFIPFSGSGRRLGN